MGMIKSITNTSVANTIPQIVSTTLGVFFIILKINIFNLTLISIVSTSLYAIILKETGGANPISDCFEKVFIKPFSPSHLAQFLSLYQLFLLSQKLITL